MRPRRDTRRAIGAAVKGLLLAGALSACGLLTKKVKDEECEKWADRVGELATDALGEATDKCDKDVRKELKQGLADSVRRRQKKLLARCQKHVDEPYEGAASECVLKAKDLSGLKKCKLSFAAFDDPKSDEPSLDDALELVEKNCSNPWDKSPAVAASEAYATKVCKCKDADCVKDASDAFAKEAEKLRDVKGSEADARLIEAAVKRALDCSMKTIMKESGSPGAGGKKPKGDDDDE
jgi:hypothetical protein